MIQRVLTPMNLLEFSSPILFNHIHFGCRSAAHALCAGTIAKPKDGKFKGKQWKWALIGEALWQSSARLYNSEMLNGVICLCFERVVFCIDSEHLNLLTDPSNFKLNPRSLMDFQPTKAWEQLSYPLICLSEYCFTAFWGLQKGWEFSQTV